MSIISFSSHKPYFSKDDFKSFSKCRIIQKNLVHVQGFPDSIADKFLLSQPEYFGQFGTITKLVVVSKDEKCKNYKYLFIEYIDQHK